MANVPGACLLGRPKTLLLGPGLWEIGVAIGKGQTALKNQMAKGNGSIRGNEQGQGRRAPTAAVMAIFPFVRSKKWPAGVGPLAKALQNDRREDINLGELELDGAIRSADRGGQRNRGTNKFYCTFVIVRVLGHLNEASILFSCLFLISLTR